MWHIKYLTTSLHNPYEASKLAASYNFYHFKCITQTSSSFLDVSLISPSSSYLIHLPPLRVQVAVHMMRGEDLCSYTQNGIRVRLPID